MYEVIGHYLNILKLLGVSFFFVLFKKTKKPFRGSRFGLLFHHKYYFNVTNGLKHVLFL